MTKKKWSLLSIPIIILMAISTFWIIKDKKKLVCNQNKNLFPSFLNASLFIDVDNDGDLDLIVSPIKNGDKSDRLYINNGGYLSQSKVPLPPRYMGASGGTVNMIAIDANGDNFKDLLFTTVDARESSFYQTSKIQLFINQKDGSFKDESHRIEKSHYKSWIEWIRVGDINKDGRDDFIITDPGSPGFTEDEYFGGRIYIQDKEGNFNIASVNFFDGKNNYTDTRLVWRQWGPDSNNRQFAMDVFLGDVNNDGVLDIVSTANGIGAMATFINESTPKQIKFRVQFSFIYNEVLQPKVDRPLKNGLLIDIDDDGFQDLLLSESITNHPYDKTPILAYRNNSSGVFTLDNRLIDPMASVSHARQWLKGDFDGDDNLDVFIVDHGYDNPPYEGAQSFLLTNYNGKLHYARPDIPSGIIYSHGGAVGDFNQDGRADVFLNNLHKETPYRRLFLKNKNEGFTHFCY